jgi:uncharacterized protein YjbI with pentapeptide repeats
MKDTGSINIDLNVSIKRYHIDENQLLEFIEERKSGVDIAQGSLVEYVQEKFYSGQNVVVVPDLSNQRFESIGNINGIDFTGCKISGAWFQFVDLKDTIFCDADLSDVTFWNCDMKNVDMRGADLSGCQFDGYDDNWMNKKERDEKFENIKFSSTEGLFDKYIKNNDEILNEKQQEFLENKSDRAKEKQQKIDRINDEIIDARKGISWTQAGYVAAGLNSGNEKYDRLVSFKAELIAEKLEIDREVFHIGRKECQPAYIISPSLINVMEAQTHFDPGYIRGSDKLSRDQNKQYISMTRKDVESYLIALKEEANLEINEFAKRQMASKGIKILEGSKVIADLSSKKLSNGEIEQVNLSGLDFTGARLKEACFSGANLQNCKFIEADLSNAIFESADIIGAQFKETAARDTNFFYCNMSSAQIDTCDFKRAFMRGSDGRNANIDNVNFNYSNIKYGKWNDVSINDATFNYADLEGVSLARADMKKVQMQYVILDKAIMNNCKLIQSDLSNALMQDVKAKASEIQNSILINIEAKGIDLTDSQLNELVNLQGADLENAIFNRVNAERVNFIQANMSGIEGEFANLSNAQLQSTNLRFANLSQAVLDNVKASGLDMTGADLRGISAKKADFSKGILEGIKAERAIFVGANFTDSNLRGSRLNDAILEKIEAKRVDLRTAELQRVSLVEANLTEAKVDDATNMYQANVTKVIGDLEHEGIDGRKTKTNADAQVKISNEIHKAEEISSFAKGIGVAAKEFGGFMQAASEYVKQPLSSKVAALIGAVICTIAVAGLVISAVATAGLSLAVGAAVVAGASVIAAGSGAVAGYFLAPKIGVSSIALAVAGTVVSPGVGTGIGLAAAIAANEMIKQVTGDTIDGHIATGMNKGGEALKAMGGNIGLTDEQEKLLDNKSKAKENYIEPEKQQNMGKNYAINHEQANLEQQIRSKQSAIGKESKIKSIDLVLGDLQKEVTIITKNNSADNKKVQSLLKNRQEKSNDMSINNTNKK